MQHIKTGTKSIVESVTCDLCGAVIVDGGYDVDEVEVRRKKGLDFPEGGHGVRTSVDMCGKCFDEKLVPWLRSQCVEPHTEDYAC